MNNELTSQADGLGSMNKKTDTYDALGSLNKPEMLVDGPNDFVRALHKMMNDVVTERLAELANELAGGLIDNSRRV